MMSCVMRSPSCSQTFRSLCERRALGVLDEQVVQQQAAALNVAARLFHEFHEGSVNGAPAQAHPAGEY